MSQCYQEKIISSKYRDVIMIFFYNNKILLQKEWRRYKNGAQPEYRSKHKKEKYNNITTAESKEDKSDASDVIMIFCH